MADVSIVIDVLRQASTEIRAAAQSIAVVGDPGIASETAMGSPEVATTLAQVGTEQSVRATVAADSLSSAGGMPARAASEFAALDRGMMPN